MGTQPSCADQLLGGIYSEIFDPNFGVKRLLHYFSMSSVNSGPILLAACKGPSYLSVCTGNRTSVSGINVFYVFVSKRTSTCCNNTGTDDQQVQWHRATSRGGQMAAQPWVTWCPFPAVRGSQLTQNKWRSHELNWRARGETADYLCPLKFWL